VRHFDRIRGLPDGYRAWIPALEVFHGAPQAPASIAVAWGTSVVRIATPREIRRPRRVPAIDRQIHAFHNN
jgi:hypothetical protein